MKKSIRLLIPLSILSVFYGCASIPEGAVAVGSFEKDRYLGKWYEIARLDFVFERNLNNTTAEYSIRNDGRIRVRNRGYNYVTGEWKEAIGKAKFRGEPTKAELAVSFFGPFYAGYNVIALDADYRYALVAGDSLKYLWILSRERTIPEAVKSDYLKLARSLGYETGELIWVQHDE